TRSTADVPSTGHPALTFSLIANVADLVSRNRIPHRSVWRDIGRFSSKACCFLNLVKSVSDFPCGLPKQLGDVFNLRALTLVEHIRKILNETADCCTSARPQYAAQTSPLGCPDRASKPSPANRPQARQRQRATRSARKTA